MILDKVAKFCTGKEKEDYLKAVDTINYFYNNGLEALNSQYVATLSESGAKDYYKQELSVFSSRPVMLFTADTGIRPKATEKYYKSLVKKAGGDNASYDDLANVIIAEAEEVIEAIEKTDFEEAVKANKEDTIPLYEKAVAVLKDDEEGEGILQTYEMSIDFSSTNAFNYLFALCTTQSHFLMKPFFDKYKGQDLDGLEILKEIREKVEYINKLIKDKVAKWYKVEMLRTPTKNLDYYIQPLDKFFNGAWANPINTKTDEEGNAEGQVIEMGEEGEGSTIWYQIDLSNEELKNSTIRTTKQLTPKQKEIFLITFNLFMQNARVEEKPDFTNMKADDFKEYFGLNMDKWREATARIPIRKVAEYYANTQHPNKATMAMIKKELGILRHIDIDFSTEEEDKKHTGYAPLKIRDYLLNTAEVTGTYRGREVDEIVVRGIPATLYVALTRGQLTTYPRGVLEADMTRNDKNLKIKDYILNNFARQKHTFIRANKAIERENKKRKKEGLTPKELRNHFSLKLDSLYKSCDVNAKKGRERSSAEETIKAIFDQLKTTNQLKTYKLDTTKGEIRIFLD